MAANGDIGDIFSNKTDNGDKSFSRIDSSINVKHIDALEMNGNTFLPMNDTDVRELDPKLGCEHYFRRCQMKC